MNFLCGKISGMLDKTEGPNTNYDYHLAICVFSFTIFLIRVAWNYAIADYIPRHDVDHAPFNFIWMLRLTCLIVPFYFGY